MSKVKENVNKSIKYRDGLSGPEKERYDAKLKLIDFDPYEVKTWTVDVSLLPSVSYIDIVNYLLFTPSPYPSDDLKSYKGLEAYNQFVSGWVRETATIVCNGHHVVTAKVLHSQRLREKPLKPWVISSAAGKIEGAHCNCMAGLGEACTHIAALLFSIEATVRIRDSRTVTDTKAYWTLPSAVKTVQYKRARDINFTSATTAKRRLLAAVDSVCSGSPGAKPPVPPPITPIKKDTKAEPTSGEVANFFAALSNSKSKPAILAIVPPYSDNYQPVTDTVSFPKVLTELKDDKCMALNYKELVDHCSTIQVTCTAAHSASVENATQEQTKSKLWNRFRSGRVTASRAKAVCTTDKTIPSQSLIKSICYPESSKFVTDATKWGCDHEKVAREQFMKTISAEHDNCRIRDSGFVISEDSPYIGASPDGIFQCDCCGESVVEIKCPFNARNLGISACDYLIEDNGDKWLKTDHNYFYQIQTQLGVCKLPRAFFVVWTVNDIHIEAISVDTLVWNNIVESAKHLFYVAILPELVGKFYSKLSNTPVKQPFQSIENTGAACNQSSDENSSGEKLYCYCSQVEHGDMIGCDNEKCEIEWFHYGCVRIENPPKGKWFCPDCRKIPAFKKKKPRKT